MDIGHKNHFYGHSLPLIQVGQLSVAGKVFVNLLGLSLHKKSVVTLNDLLDMTIVILPQNRVLGGYTVFSMSEIP